MSTPNYPQGVSVEYASRDQQRLRNPVQYGRSSGTGLGTTLTLATQFVADGVSNRVGNDIALDPTRWPADGAFKLRVVGRTTAPDIVGTVRLQELDGTQIQGAELSFNGQTAAIVESDVLVVRDELGFVRPYANVYELVLELTGGSLVTDIANVGQAVWLID